MSFRARYPAQDGALYVVTQGGPLKPHGAYCSAQAVGSIRRDVAVGERAGLTFYVNRFCTGFVTGRVGYQPRPSQPGNGGPYEPNPQEMITVGRYRIATP